MEYGTANHRPSQEEGVMTQSMRFTLPEVLSGMLASTDKDRFSDDPARLAAMFEDLATKFSLFAPLAAAVDADAVSNALDDLGRQGHLAREADMYVLTDTGRAHCIRSKRTLFNKSDIEQLEQAAVVFDKL
jgi:hypothetical protein